MTITVDKYFPQLAQLWGTPPKDLDAFWQDLRRSDSFLEGMNRLIAPLPEFSGVQFSDVSELRVYRCMLYLLVRALRPRIMVETGVQNGLSSAFILLAMAHNEFGELISVDMPPLEERIIEQGTRPLPAGKGPGWIILDELRARHRLLLGPAQELLPKVFAEQRQVDVFLHDSDHSYSHMMFEMGLAWGFLKPGGCLLADNVEQNLAFEHFSIGVAAPSIVIASFDTPERTWRHGIMRKPALA